MPAHGLVRHTTPSVGQPVHARYTRSVAAESSVIAACECGATTAVGRNAVHAGP